nr:hypothetical protein [uncultured Nostoc sp.]
MQNLTSNHDDGGESVPLHVQDDSSSAAYEQDDEAAPKPQAIAIDPVASSGMSRTISDFDTTA